MTITRSDKEALQQIKEAMMLVSSEIPLSLTVKLTVAMLEISATLRDAKVDEG